VRRRVRQRQAARVVREQLAKERRRIRTLWISLGAVALISTAAVVNWTVYQLQGPPGYALPAGLTTDDKEGGANSGIVVADEGGAIPVSIYFDFLCQACKPFQTTTATTLNQLLAQKKIKLIWHPVSFLDSRSNPPGYSVRAASAAGCAADAGMNKVKAFGERLLAAQPAEGRPGLSDDQLIDIGGSAGIVTPSFAACVRDVKYRQWANSVNSKAIQRDVTQTPTVFVNGKAVDQPGPATITAAVASTS
jgi:protein-disulfide isomerase